MKKYLVALKYGEIMVSPRISYHNFQVIEAKNESEAVAIYNKENNCDFYSGICFGEYSEKSKTVKISVDFLKDIFE